tara:strand:- start:690 stop:1931 length:1242 start_codon:yes stop_codon:yes gene_type:complete
MSDKKVICGIDVGTTKIVVIIAEYDELGKFSVIGIGESKSNGLKRGVIVNIKETVKSLESAIEEAEKQCKHEVESVFVGISGDHIRGFNGMGVVSVGDASDNPIGSIIDRDDKDRVLESAKAMQLDSGRRILHVLSQKYTLDSRSGIEEPEGLTGSRLQVDVHCITSSRTTENDFKTCFDQLGIEINGFILEPLASSCAILSSDEKELGSIMIDIGGGTTDLVVWEGGGITNTIIYPHGGESITQDIAEVIGCPINVAEQLKLKYGSALDALNCSEKIFIEEHELDIDQKHLCAIIQARIGEILKDLRFKVEHEAGVDVSDLSFGIILTGGGSQLNDISELIKNIFDCKVRIGNPSDALTSIEQHIFNPKYSTAIGIIHYAIDHRHELSNSNVTGAKGVVRNFFTGIKELFNN